MLCKTLFGALLLAVAFSTCHVKAAENAVAVTSYGKGVQAYLEGRNERAEAYFNRAIAYGEAGPRVFYLRGLTKLAQNQLLAAESDIRFAASIEASQPTGYGVGLTLRGAPSEARAMVDRIRSETYTSSGPLVQSNRSAMRAEFRFPLEALSTIDTPGQLAQLVQNARDNQLNQLAQQSVKQTSEPMSAQPDVADELGQVDSATDDLTGNPFGDDPFGDDLEPAAAVASDTDPRDFGEESEVQIPEAARGSMSTSSIFGVLGKAVRGMMPQPPEALSNLLPGANGPPMDDESPFGGADMAEDDLFGGEADAVESESNAEPDSAEPENPFGEMSEDENPFGEM